MLNNLTFSNIYIYKNDPKKYSIAKFLAVFNSLLTADSDIPK